MKKLIFLFAFMLGLMSSANAQKISIKASAFQPNNYTAIPNSRYYNNRDNVSVGGSIEFSKKRGVKFNITNPQDKVDLHSQPISRKQLEKEKEVINNTIEKQP